MSKPSKTARRIKMVLFMAFISALFVTAVSAVHLATRELIKRNDSLFLKKSVLFTAGVVTPNTPGGVDTFFKKHVKIVLVKGKLPLYRIAVKDKISWVVTQRGTGLWGEIRAHVGFTSDFKLFTGINFLKQNETPGLGARISEKWFLEQFRGKKGPMTMVPENTKNESSTQFDAITGATVTSKAVLSIVNSALKDVVDSVSKGGAK
jgi:Na+-transporting NADH:ubiquinone oxidoreductase subunit C